VYKELLASGIWPAGCVDAKALKLAVSRVAARVKRLEAKQADAGAASAALPT
jgi:hypothetical protein